MKTIQIKIGDNQIGFNDWSEVALYSVLQLRKPTSLDNSSWAQETLAAINRLKNDPNSGVTMSRNELKRFLFND